MFANSGHVLYHTALAATIDAPDQTLLEWLIDWTFPEPAVWSITIKPQKRSKNAGGRPPCRRGAGYDRLMFSRVSHDEIDQICHDYIVHEQKAIPAPLNYMGFPKVHLHFRQPSGAMGYSRRQKRRRVAT